MGAEHVPAAPAAIRSGLRGLAPALGGVGLAAVLGAMAALAPLPAVGIVGLAIVTAAAFRAPAAHLLVLVALTATLPPELQNRFEVTLLEGGPGVLVVDVLLLTGLARAVLVLLGRRLAPRELVMGGLAVALIALAFGQALHGLALDRGASEVTAEFRVILALAGSAIIAMPIMADARERTRLLRGLVVVALAVGAWGILQWVLGLRFTGAEEALEGASSRYLTAGRTVGQYAFGVAAVMALAVWTSGHVRTAAARAALLAVVALNVVAVILTFERTFWVVTVLGIAFVMLGARGRQRARLLLVTPAVFGALLLVMLTVAPAEVAAGRERLLSLGEYHADVSVRYRVEESRRVLQQVAERPLSGSGFAATILIGRPGTTVLPSPRRYAENGYLWVTWKLGIPGLALVLALLGMAIARRRHPGERDRLAVAARRGAQAGLLGLAAASVTFPSFNALAITPVMGVLLALCAMPVATSEGSVTQSSVVAR